MIDLQITLPCLQKGGKFWVAFSGGLDSTVLLHHLVHCSDVALTAVHVNHGLQSSADQWAEHCQSFCDALNVELIQLQVQVEGAGDMGMEAAARAVRYEALGKLLGHDDILLTAHHQDDQAETLLLQLLRGSGPHGLACMPVESSLGEGKLYRPLLAFTRSQLARYANRHGMKWVEDPSNQNLDMRRNYLRHRVLPLIAEGWPQYAVCLERSAELQAEASILLDDLADLDLQQCRGQIPGSLSITALLALSGQRRRNVIRYWLRSQNMAVPNQAHMQRIETDMLAAREDSNPVVDWHDLELHRYRDDLLAMSRLPPAPTGWERSWNLQQPLVLPDGCGWLEAECAQGAGLRLENPRLELRFNQPGERLQPAFSKHHRRLKHLFQENGVPPWVRERLPLIYHGQRLAAVADRWIAADFAARRDEQGWRIHWHDAPMGWLAPESLSHF